METISIQKNKIPNGWETKKLGDLCRVKRGASPRPKGDPRYFGGNIPWIKISDVTSSGKVINETKDTVTEEGKLLSVFVKKGTLIMSICASIGKPVFVGKDACIHDGFVAFLDLDKQLLKEYLYYFLLGNPKIVKARARGGTQDNINSEFVRQIEIPVPPLPIQQKIVSKLNAFFEHYNTLREEKQNNKEKHKNIFRYIIQLLIPIKNLPNNWELKKIQEIAEIGQGGTPSRSIKEYWNNGTIPWLRSGEIRNNIVYDSKEKITELGLKESSATLVPKGTLLLAMTGQGLTRGRVSLLAIEACANQSCAHIKVNKAIIDERFLWYYLLSQYWYIRSLDKGKNQPGLNTSIIKKFDIPVPPLSVQKRIIEKIEQVKNRIENIANEHKNLDYKLEQLPKSVLSKAFRGELIVNGG